MGTNALHGQKQRSATREGEEASATRRGVQRSAGYFCQQPEGNGWLTAPPGAALLAKTLGLRFVGRPDRHPTPTVRVCVHGV